MPTNSTNISGDIIQGDKFSGDKIAGNKIETQTYIERQVIVQGVEISDLEQLPPEPGDPPYKGLSYFTANDHEWFFGREKITAVLVNRLHDLSFLAVVGDSGSGKSSLVRAGVIPVITRDVTLADGTVPPLGQWRIATLTPTGQPLAKLAATLFPDDHAQQAIIQEAATQNSHTLHDGLAAQSKPGHKLLLFVDQFEEIFTLCEKETERQAFINNLLTLAEHSTDTKLIITLRADFYVQCLRYEGMRQILKTSQEPLGAMSSQELATAILEPAAKGNWQFQAGLVEEILDDVGEEPGRLPLLSHALLETWQRRRGRVLTLSGYQEAGKVRGAIAQTADAVYKELSGDEQKTAQRIFLRLTELGAGTQDMRRRVSQTELGEDAVVRAVTKTLTDARLITTSETAVDVSHEALIREWPRLRSWLDANREGLLIHRRLTNVAKTWAEEGQDPSYLYTGLRLGEAAQWAEANSAEMNEQEQAFLNASLQAEKQGQRNKRRLQVGTAVLVSILIMALIGAFFINGERNKAELAEETAVAAQATSAVNELIAIANEEEAIRLNQSIQANQLAREAENAINTDPDLSLLLSTTGFQINRDIITRKALWEAVMSPFKSSLSPDNDSSFLSFSPNGQFILTSNFETYQLWSSNGQFQFELPHDYETLYRLPFIVDSIYENNFKSLPAFSSDSKMIFQIRTNNQNSRLLLKLWDTLGNEVVTASLPNHVTDVFLYKFDPSDDKILLIVGQTEKGDGGAHGC